MARVEVNLARAKLPGILQGSPAPQLLAEIILVNVFTLRLKATSPQGIKDIVLSRR